MERWTERVRDTGRGQGGREVEREREREADGEMDRERERDTERAGRKTVGERRDERWTEGEREREKLAGGVRAPFSGSCLRIGPAFSPAHLTPPPCPAPSQCVSCEIVSLGDYTTLSLR